MMLHIVFGLRLFSTAAVHVYCSGRSLVLSIFLFLVFVPFRNLLFARYYSGCPVFSAVDLSGVSG